MKINNIVSIGSSHAFKANYSFDRRKLSEPSIKIDKQKIKMGLTGLAAIASVIMCHSYMVNNNVNIRESISNIFRKERNISKDPFLAVLRDERGHEAVLKYKGLRAEGKINSLYDKILNGDLIHESPKVFGYLKKNKEELSRAVNAVI